MSSNTVRMCISIMSCSHLSHATDYIEQRKLINTSIISLPINFDTVKYTYEITITAHQNSLLY